MKKTTLIITFVFILTFFLNAITPAEFKNIEKNLENQATKYHNSLNHKQIKANKATTEYQVGDTKTLWKWDLSVMPPTWVQTPSTCKAVGEHCYLFVADEDWQIHMDESDVQVVMNYLENQTMATDEYGAIEMDEEHFGPVPDELDNDPKIIVFYSALGSFGGSTFDGYFSIYNEVTEEESHNLNPPGHSNECEMIYMTCHPLSPTDPVRISVLSHELQHMIHWGFDQNEETWLNEGMSELAMVYFGMPDPITNFPSNPNNTLNEWNQNFADYVKTMLFFTYLEEHYDDGSLIKDIVAEPANSITGISNQLAEHSIDKTFDEIFTDWTIANYLDEPDVENGLYNYEELNLPNFSTQATHSSYPANRTGTVKPWAAKYIRINQGESNLNIHFEANHEINITAIRIGIGENISTVNKYTVLDSLNQNLPAIIEDYSYIILAISNKNNTTLNYSYSITETGADADENAICNDFRIKTYPNPVNFERQNLTINVISNKKSIGKDRIEIFNIKGQKIRVLETKTDKVVWNGKDIYGKAVSSGLYFYKIIHKNKRINGNILVIK